MSDHQQRRMYRAEAAWANNSPMDTEAHLFLPQANDLHREICEDFNVRPTSVTRNNRIKQWGGWYSHRKQAIEVPAGNITKRTVLHETAHYLNDKLSAAYGHGWEFASMLLNVIDAYYGARERDALQDSFTAAGIIFTPEAEMRRRSRNAAATDARYKRDGQTGKGFVLTFVSDKYEVTSDKLWFRHRTPGYLSKSSYGARVYRKRVTAEKHARFGITDVVVEVDVTFDADANRWEMDHSSQNRERCLDAVREARKGEQ